MNEAPAGQLDECLHMMTAAKIYVPRDAVYFDNVTGSVVDGRHGILRLVDAVAKGQYHAVGALKPHRMFRNHREREDVFDEFERRGVRLMFASRPSYDERDPRQWRESKNEAINDEGYVRDVGKTVSDQLHYLASKRGHPLGKLPEGFVVAEREPPRMGKLGRILRWEHNPELAPVITTGRATQPPSTS